MIRTLVVVSGLTALAPAMAEPLPLTPGKWSSEIKMGFGGETFTEKRVDCISPEEARSEPTEFVKNFTGGGACSVSDLNEAGSTVSFQMECPNESLASASIRFTFADRSFSFDGDVNLITGQDGQRTSGKMSVKANYVGACDLN